jgi:hypothetical protein
MHKALWSLGLAGLAACGAAAGSFAKLERSAGVIQGGMDPALVGTFRLSSQSPLEADVLKLLVLRTDRTFFAEYVAGCPEGFCSRGTVPFEGTYEQVREMPDPTRAAAIVLTGQFSGSGGKRTPYAVSLRRAAIPDSPLIGLYHAAESATDTAPARPFYMLAHPIEAWCGAQVDCDSQNLLEGSSCEAFVCRESTCVCR